MLLAFCFVVWNCARGGEKPCQQDRCLQNHDVNTSF
jgi:hypothetical protein